MAAITLNDGNRKTDSMLVIAAKGGDRQAFDELVRRYQDRVFGVAQRITKNREDSEDVMQECFQRAYLHLRSFEERCCFSTWLIRIAINEALMLLRRRGSRKEVTIVPREDHEDLMPEAFVDHYPSPEVSYWRGERKKILEKAVNSLSYSLRTTVLLREFQQLTLTEMAQMLGITVATVKARLHRGRRRLRARLKPELLSDLVAFYSARSTQF